MSHLTNIKFWRLVVVMTFAALVAGDIYAESIWQRRNVRAGFLFRDNRARNIGDVLTVLITETTAIAQTEARSLGKQTDADADFQFEGDLQGNSVGNTGTIDTNFNQTSNRTFDSNSDFDSDRAFTDSIGVVVVDLLPNGNLVVEGTRTRVIAGESRVLRVSGIVRPDDILFNPEGNTVESQYVGNLRLWYEGKGIETDYTKPGWFSRLITKVWPF